MCFQINGQCGYVLQPECLRNGNYHPYDKTTQEGIDPITLAVTVGERDSLTLKVLVVTIYAQWEGMGDVGSARYEPALLPPCPTIRVLSYNN